MFIPKPDKCKGCPFYELSPYITPDYYVKDSEVCIVAQAPGEHEEEGRRITGYVYKGGKKLEITESVRPQPLIGPTGKWLQDDFWPYTKIPYREVSRANIIKCRPHGKNDLPNINSNKSVNGITPTMLKDAINHCTKSYLNINNSNKYIIAMGGISLYALTGLEGSSNGITDWRGWVLGVSFIFNAKQILGFDSYYHPIRNDVFISNIYPVIHIASLFKNPTLYRATVLDFIKFGRFVRGEWPIETPYMNINIQPESIPKYIGFDTEYDVEDNNRLEMWSLADVEGNIYVYDVQHTHVSNILPIQPGTTVVTQNGLVDLPHFIKVFDVTTIKLEDCMLGWATLFPGEPTNLDYMTSCVGRYNRHKHIRTTRDLDMKYFYAGLDADTTLNHVWKYQLMEFTKDKLSWQEYMLRRQPLLYIIDKFQKKGVEVYKERVEYVAELLDKEMEDIVERSKEVAGNPLFNIASHEQVSNAVYEGVYVKPVKEKPVRVKKSKGSTSSKQLKLISEEIIRNAEVFLASQDLEDIEGEE